MVSLKTLLIKSIINLFSIVIATLFDVEFLQ